MRNVLRRAEASIRRRIGSETRRPGKRSLLCLEPLEGRLVLSASLVAVAAPPAVTAVVTGDTLTITAPASSSFTISQTSAGSIAVTGSGGTTVNGSPTNPAVNKVSKNLNLSLGAGDTVTFDETNPIALPGDLTINGGPGGEQISCSHVSSLSVGGSALEGDQPGDGASYWPIPS